MMITHNQRQVYGQTLVELGRENENIVVLEADLGKSTMSHLFQVEFPNRYFEMGIAEADMVSFAAGLSLTGKTSFVNSFAVFAAGRPYDQIRQGVSIPRLNVKIIGSSSGFSDFGDGSTHQSVEDIAIMRAIPNMTVIVPSDGVETQKVIRAIAQYNGPVYVRLSRNDIPDVFPVDIRFEIGKPYVLRDGKDIVVFAMGIMVYKALEAADELEKSGISVKVVNVSTLKPLDEDGIRSLAEGAKGIVTAEEHSCIGGLSSAVAFALRSQRTLMEVVAVNDQFGQSAHSHEELLEYYGLTAGNIVDKAKELLHKA
jgi:Transketolase, C-terminal subunit